MIISVNRSKKHGDDRQEQDPPIKLVVSTFGTQVLVEADLEVLPILIMVNVENDLFPHKFKDINSVKKMLERLDGQLAMIRMKSAIYNGHLKIMNLLQFQEWRKTQERYELAVYKPEIAK